jgi:hypothetical protein
MRPVFSLIHRVGFLFTFLLSACGGDDTTNAEVPTFYEHVAPIVYKHCTDCHSEGGMAPFPLLRHEQAAAVAKSMKSSTASRQMPPFHVDNTGDCNTYTDANWLADEEIATIAAWADAGAPAGDPAKAPAQQERAGGLDEVSMTLDLPVYTPKASVDDDYRCFVLDQTLSAEKFLIAVEPKPGEERMVHHMLLYVLPDDKVEREVERLDESEDGPGYTCFGSARVDGVSVVAAWSPGASPTRSPEGTGLRIPAGRKFVVQVHYNMANGVFEDHTTIDLQLVDRVERRAEIIPIPHFGLSLDPRQKHVVSEAILDFNRPAPFTIYATNPHMHLLGRTMDSHVLHGQEETCIVKVTDWNYHWQGFYQYEMPIAVQQGDKVRIRCGYDTTASTQTVVWGDRTQDEMCLNILYIAE